MKAIVQREYGAPDLLELHEIDTPAPKANEVLVRVRAAGVNWADWAAIQGLPYVLRLVYGLRKPRSGVRGSDVAGTIEAVGKEVTGLQPGDEVLGQCTAAFAEYACAKEDTMVHKPASVSFEQAAAVPMAALVALQALRDVAQVQPGQEVLINGASGGIGTFTIQIAKSKGAEVTGVCSTENLDLVRSIGADHVIDYTKEDFTKNGQRYDCILDMADKHSLAERRRALTPKGTLIPNSGVGGRWFGSMGRIVRARAMSPFVGQRLKPFLSLPKHDDLVEITRLIENGKVTPVIDRTYPLEETAKAVAYVGAGHAKGKTIITM